MTAEPEDAEHRAQLRKAALAVEWDFAEVDGFSLCQEGSGALCVLALPKKGGDVAALCQILKARLKATERFEYQVSLAKLEVEAECAATGKEQEHANAA